MRRPLLIICFTIIGLAVALTAIYAYLMIVMSPDSFISFPDHGGWAETLASDGDLSLFHNNRHLFDVNLMHIAAILAGTSIIGVVLLRHRKRQAGFPVIQAEDAPATRR